MFITVQGYITANTSAPHRTKGMAMFLSGFFAGSLCGAATGGILADHIGYSMTFFLSAFLGLAAVLFVRRFIPKAPPAQEAKPKKLF
ncbi:MAG: MFS transporter [Sulfuricellaceae bacterium]|nr:MFS transporter [Sulfuricellaceae bacterium]